LIWWTAIDLDLFIECSNDTALSKDHESLLLLLLRGHDGEEKNTYTKRLGSIENFLITSLEFREFSDQN
jgi:hypothetical protein